MGEVVGSIGGAINKLVGGGDAPQHNTVPLNEQTKGLIESQRQAALGSSPESEAQKLQTSGTGLMQDQDSINRNIRSLGSQDTGAMSQALQNRASNVYGNYQTNQNVRNTMEGTSKSFERQSKNYEDQHIVSALAVQAYQRKVQQETDELNTRYAVVGSILGNGVRAYSAYANRQNPAGSQIPIDSSTLVDTPDYSQDGNSGPGNIA